MRFEKPLLYTNYYFSLGIGNNCRRTGIPIKEHNLGQAIERINPGLLSHAYSMTIHWSTGRTLYRSDNMYVGDVASRKDLSLSKKHIIAAQRTALNDVHGNKDLLTNDYCLCSNGSLRLLKKGEKVFDTNWKCVWPLSEKGTPFAPIDNSGLASGIQQVNFKTIATPNRQYQIEYKTPGNIVGKFEINHDHIFRIINPNQFYNNITGLTFSDGVYDAQENKFQPQTPVKTAVLGSRVLSMEEIRKENIDIYLGLKNVWKEHDLENNPIATDAIVNLYDNTYSFLANDTVVMDNNMNVIYPLHAIHDDLTFKNNYLNALAQTTASEISQRNDRYFQDTIRNKIKPPRYILNF